MELELKTDTFTPSKQAMVTAMSGEIIASLPDHEIMRWIGVIDLEVRTIMQHKGKLNRNELREFHLAIMQCLREEFSGFTMEEVKLACRKGSRGVLSDDNIHFSVRALVSWLNAFKEAKNRFVLDLRKRQKVIDTKKQLTDSEKKAFVQKMYERWKNDDQPLFGLAVAYDFAKELQLFKGRKFDFKTIERQALQNIKGDYDQSSRNGRKAYSQLKKKVKQCFNEGASRPESLKIECQKLTIIELFKQIKKEEDNPINNQV